MGLFDSFEILDYRFLDLSNLEFLTEFQNSFDNWEDRLIRVDYQTKDLDSVMNNYRIFPDRTIRLCKKGIWVPETFTETVNVIAHWEEYNTLPWEGKIRSYFAYWDFEIIRGELTSTAFIEWHKHEEKE